MNDETIREMVPPKCYVMFYELTQFCCVIVYYNCMCIAIVCLPGCDVINFEINLIFLIKQFFYMTKKSRKNLNILRKKRASKVK